MQIFIRINDFSKWQMHSFIVIFILSPWVLGICDLLIIIDSVALCFFVCWIAYLLDSICSHFILLNFHTVIIEANDDVFSFYTFYEVRLVLSFLIDLLKGYIYKKMMHICTDNICARINNLNASSVTC